MSSNNVAHISSVDKGLKMKIKRTKGSTKVDSKHEVVNSEPVSRSTTLGHSLVSVASGNLTPSSTSSSSVISTSSSNTTCGMGNSLSFIIEATAPSLLSSSSSSSSTSSAISPLQNNVPSHITVANPKVALLKAVTAGIVQQVYSSNANNNSNASGAATKPPLKVNPLGSSIGSDTTKDGKSPKTKAAYNKKCKDAKEKNDSPSAAGPAAVLTGPHIAHTENKTGLCVVSTSQVLNSAPISFPSHAGVMNSTVTSEPRPGDTVHVKREALVHDPYEFNAKVEDKIELPPKKLKLEKADGIETAISPQAPPPLQQQSPSPAMLHPPATPKQHQQPQKRSIGVDVRSIGVVTEPDALGPCEPGTLVGLEGIVWKETDNGLLVVNVTWRGKTYVGTLMDATRYAWAPPRPNGCESPVSDFESRTPKGRGKRNCRNSVQSNERLPEGRRLRKGRRGTVNSSSSNFTAPPSPAKSDVSMSNMKRKTKANDIDSEKAKRSRSCSLGVTGAESPTPDGYIVCPEPNCHKKYKHMNGLRYHRTHAHSKSSLNDDTKDDEEEDEDEEEKVEKKEKSNLDRTEKIKSKEKQKGKDQQQRLSSSRDSKDSIDDDVPLKEIANKASSQANALKVEDVSSCKDRSEEESSSNDGSSTSMSTSSGNIKVEPQVILTKAYIPVQKEPASPGIVPALASKKKESNSLDVSVSSSSALVPCAPSGEAAPSVCSDSSNISSPTVTSARPPLQQSLPLTSSTSSVAQVCPKTNVHQSSPLSSASNQANLISTSALGMTLNSDRQSTAKSSAFLKSTNSVRLIVPAPPLQISGNPQQHNSISSIQGLGSTLKPIQPKPTVLGECLSVSPALSDLSKDKHRKSKKKKDIQETPTFNSTNPGLKNLSTLRESGHALLDIPSQDDLYKCERAPVIKNSNPSAPFESSSPISDLSKLSFQPSLNTHKLQNSPSSETHFTGGPRVTIPPSSLAVSSSPCLDNKSTINDDVHSPAYSDISDANDSSSPVQHDSPKKESSHKKDGHLNGPSHLIPDNNSLPQHYRNMYYYGTPHYVPHGINPQMASPTLSDTLIKKEEIDEKRPPSCNEPLLEKKDGTRSAQDTELQQNSLINYLAHLHGVPPTTVQLQYNLAGYNPTNMDSSYAVLAQQALDQQKRLMQHHDMSSKGEDLSGKLTQSVTLSTNRPARQGFEPTGKVILGSDITGQHDHKRPNVDRDHVLKEKHGEIPLNVKDNIELKNHVSSGYDQQNFQSLKQQRNDFIREQMFHQQRQKMFENQRQDKRKSPPELTSTSVGQQHLSGVISRSQQESKPLEIIPLDIIKKEGVHIDSSRLDSIDSTKRFEVKDEAVKSGQASVDITSSISRSSSQPNIPQSNAASSSSSTSLSSSSAAASLSVPIVGSLPSTAAGFAYTQYYPHFRPVQLDSMYRALSPHIIGYASSPQGFIHPTQLGYRTPIVDPDGKSPDVVESLRGDTSRLVNSPSFSPVHKIHELHEKVRPSPGVPSPAPSKSGGSGDSINASGSTTPGPASEKVKDKQREYTSSPPTQRHVHTHHHTHVMSGFPPLYTPDAYTMFGHTAAAATIQTAAHPFPPPPSPAAPKS